MNDSFRCNKNLLLWFFCAISQVCETFGDSLVSCEGDCNRLFHPECMGSNSGTEGELLCPECKTGEQYNPPITSKRSLICHVFNFFWEFEFWIEVFLNNLRSLICLSLSLSPGSHPCFSCKDMEGEVKRCSVNGCGRFYHDTCARKFTGTTTDTRGLRCPQHSCATCCLDRDLHKACKGTPQIYWTYSLYFTEAFFWNRQIGQPQFLFFILGRMMRCIRCPVAYHTGDGCVAAGSVLITPHIIICSNHSSSRKNGHFSSPVNVGWCFICARGTFSLILQSLRNS